MTQENLQEFRQRVDVCTRDFCVLIEKNNKLIGCGKNLFMGNVLPVDLGFAPSVIVDVLVLVYKFCLCPNFRDSEARWCSCGCSI